MPTVREYFQGDFTSTLNAALPADLSNSGVSVRVERRVHLDFNSSSKFVSYYIPGELKLLEFSSCLLEHIDDTLAICSNIEVKAGILGEEPLSDSKLRFNGRVFIYTDGDLAREELDSLNALAARRNLILTVRGGAHARERSAIEKPLAFISHDSRDKDQIARPIADGLRSLLCPVWFDEYSLRVGDNLRDSIEKGLKDCPKCVVVLSPHFLSNSGWTKIEFDAVFTKQILQRQQAFLPIWAGVTVDEVFQYCPSLANLLGIQWKGDAKEVVNKLYKAITRP